MSAFDLFQVIVLQFIDYVLIYTRNTFMLIMTFRTQTLYALAVPLGRKMANIQNLLLTAFVTGKIDLKRYL